jgi:hypothetical protein
MAYAQTEDLFRVSMAQTRRFMQKRAVTGTFGGGTHRISRQQDSYPCASIWGKVTQRAGSVGPELRRIGHLVVNNLEAMLAGLLPTRNTRYPTGDRALAAVRWGKLKREESIQCLYLEKARGMPLPGVR